MDQEGSYNDIEKDIVEDGVEYDESKSDRCKKCCVVNLQCKI